MQVLQCPKCKAEIGPEEYYPIGEAVYFLNCPSCRNHFRREDALRGVHVVATPFSMTAGESVLEVIKRDKIPLSETQAAFFIQDDLAKEAMKIGNSNPQ